MWDISAIGDLNGYIFACGFVWASNLNSDIMRRTFMKSIWEQGAEGNIWARKDSNGRMFEKTAQ
jgi:hypothetical protein